MENKSETTALAQWKNLYLLHWKIVFQYGCRLMGLAGYREALLHHINRFSTCSLSRVPLQQLTRESPTALLPYAARGISSQSAPRFAQQASNEVRLLKNSILMLHFMSSSKWKMYVILSCIVVFMVSTHLYYITSFFDG